MTELNEGYNIEYKESVSKKPNYLKVEIVSFLNSDTGETIYLGASDDGIPVEHLNKSKQYKEWEELLSNWVASAFRSKVMGLILVDPNCTPFKLFVSAGSNKHYYYTDVEGMNWEGVYISNGSSKRRASNLEIRRMINRHIFNSFDSEKIERNDLTFDYAE